MSRYVAFLLFGILGFAPLMYPVLLKRVRLHSVFGWMIASAVIGLVFRPAYLLFFSPDRRVDEAFFWRDVPVEEMISPAAVFTLSTFALSVTYVFTQGGSTTVPLSWGQRVEGQEQVRFVATVVALVGLIASFQFVQSTGGFSVL